MTLTGLMPMNRLSQDQETIFRQCTGRAGAPHGAAYKSIWLCCGRRAGKSFTSAMIACYMACFRNWLPFMSPGERCIVLLVAGDKEQAKILHRYCLGILQAAPILCNRIISYNANSFDLQGAITIEVVTRSYRAVRGRSVAVALLDECCFWRADEESANPDKAVLAAIKPSMATFGDHSLLVAASSPYDKHGLMWEAHQRYFGVDDPNTLVWVSPTRTMNPSVPAKFVDREIIQGGVAAECEYMALFRADCDKYVNADIVAEAVVSGRHELAPDPKLYRYFGFVDPSGGQQDSFTLGIAHAEDQTLVLDCLREIRPPLSPQHAVKELSQTLKSYHLRQVRGDAYSGAIIREMFQAEGINYTVSRDSKSEIYLEFLPALNSGRVRLLDDKRLIKQLLQLERRTGRGTGRDVVDHPKGSSYHDDVINCCAGALVATQSAPAPLKVTMPFIAERPRSVNIHDHSNHPMELAASGLNPACASGAEYALAPGRGGDGLLAVGRFIKSKGLTP